MRTSVLAVLDEEDAYTLLRLQAAERAVPLEYGAEMYATALRAKQDVMEFESRLIVKYLAPNRTVSELEDLFGDYGYEFDVVAGAIIKEES